jgi:hypothetical protein
VTALERTTNPAALPVLTVLVHPEHDPDDRAATRVLLTSRALCPWVPITGRYITQMPALAHNGVWGWQIQSFAQVLAVFSREVR